MREIEAWLETDAAAGPAPPQDFTDAVLRRVEAAQPLRDRVLVAAAAEPFPWWVAAARHPATVLATVLLAVVWWGRERIAEAGLATVSAAHALWLRVAAGDGALGAAGTAAAFSPLADPAVALALAVAAAPLLVHLTLRLERWSERLAGG
jgi:hypothetical protein